ncbi:MAG TPA: hypothetical protein VE620_05735, partial [Myxococcales bacterium]|nr:hypothetical protein [Myxococcales bacterium]
MSVLIAALFAAAGGPSHHGFFLRMDLDAGYHNTSGGSTATIDGPAGGFGISIGGNVADNLALFGIASGSGSGGDNTRAGHALLGIGLTYYLMPANVFLSGAVGFAGMR